MKKANISNLLRNIKLIYWADMLRFNLMKLKNKRVKLTNFEKQKFEKAELVVRAKVKEGHRTFSTSAPPNLCKNFSKILKFLNT